MTCGGGWLGRLLALAMWSAGPACAAAFAQSGTDGAIGGRLLNSAGLPIPGARILARSLDTGLEAHTTSGPRGDFLLIRLPVGEYSLSIEGASLPSAVPGSAEVRLGEVTEVEAWLHPLLSGLPAAILPVGVAGTGALAAITSTELNALPVPGGQWRALELSGARANPAATEDGSSGEVSFRGLDPTQNSSRLDGANTEESFGGERLGGGVGESSGGSQEDGASGPGSGWPSTADGGRRTGSAFTFSQLSVREFRVESQGDAAQYGSALYAHGGGGVLSTITRSGGVQFHGSAVFIVRDAAWAAADPFAMVTTYANGTGTYGLARPRDLREEYGGSVGGPVSAAMLPGWLHSVRSASPPAHGSPHIFFFYAFSGMHRDFPAISSPGYSGFYNLTAMQTALLATRGVSARQTAAALSYINSLTGTVPRHSDEDVNFGRIDWRGRGTQRVGVEYNRARWANPAGARSSPVVDRAVSSIGSSFGKADMGVVRWVRFLRPSLSNEVRGQLSRELQYETAQPALAQEPAVGPGGLPPEVRIGPSGFVFGTPAGLGQRAWPDERRVEVADVVAWVDGQQFLQFGADASAIRDFTDSLYNSEGTFNYDGGITNGKAGGLVDWITDFTYGVNAYPNGGCPSIAAPTHDFCFRSYTQSFGEQSLRFGRQEWAGFLQDDWRATATLTLHAGVRYEYEFLPLPQQPNAGLDAVFGARGATSVFPEDRNNFGPRLGLVWQPATQRAGQLGAGFGMYYGRMPGATIQAALLDTAVNTAVTRIRILPTTETTCPQQPQVGFGYPCAFLAQPGGIVAETTSAVVFDRHFRLPMIQQGTISYEHGLGLGMLARASYVMNLDRQLPNSVDINITPSNDMRIFELQGGTGRVGARDGETFAVPVYTTRVSPSFGPVTDLVSNVNATYHGLTVEARRGYAGSHSAALRGLEFHTAFTWSKAIDFGQNPGAWPRTSGQFDPFTVRYDKGLSSLNFPHRLVASGVWTPPAGVLAQLFGGGQRAQALARGWMVSAIFSESSGRGYSYRIFGGSRLTGGRESINGSGGSVVLPTVGRNTLRLPDHVNLNLRLARSFGLHREGMRLLVSAEAFNATNHVNITGVEQRAYLASPAVSGVTPLVFQDAATVATEGINEIPFGTYTSSSTSQSRQREIQLSLRLEF